VDSTGLQMQPCDITRKWHPPTRMKVARLRGWGIGAGLHRRHRLLGWFEQSAWIGQSPDLIRLEACPWSDQLEERSIGPVPQDQGPQRRW